MMRAPSPAEYASMTERVKAAVASMVAEYEAVVARRRYLLAEEMFTKRQVKYAPAHVAHLDRDWAAEAARMLPEIVALYDDDEDTLTARRTQLEAASAAFAPRWKELSGRG